MREFRRFLFLGVMLVAVSSCGGNDLAGAFADGIGALDGFATDLGGAPEIGLPDSGKQPDGSAPPVDVPDDTVEPPEMTDVAPPQDLILSDAWEPDTIVDDTWVRDTWVDETSDEDICVCVDVPPADVPPLCGGPGQMCCEGQACDGAPGLECSPDGFCVAACGGLDEDCCVGDTCDDDMLVCLGGTCRDLNDFCGGEGQPCCPDGSCDFEHLACQEGDCVQRADICPDPPVCPIPDMGSPDVDIVFGAGDPPELTGGTLTDAVYELVQIEAFTDRAFSALVLSASVTSNGNTYGSLEFTGPSWGIYANLDLYLEADVMSVGPIGQSIEQVMYTGGCYWLDGAVIHGDLLECAQEIPGNSNPSDSFPFEVTEAGLRVLVTLPKDWMIAMLPEEYQGAGGLIIVDDVHLLFAFVPMAGR